MTDPAVGNQAMAAAELAQQSTSKVPPYWSPELELRGYPFRLWMRDVRLWIVGTELPADRQGPAIVQRLGGTAKALVREVDPDTISQGLWDANTGQQVRTGVQVLLRGLEQRYGQMDVEAATMTIVDHLTFRRRPHESIDDAVSRSKRARRAPTRSGPCRCL